MDFILSNFSANLILITLTLFYIFLLILLIVQEMKSSNKKIYSFLWIFSSFIFPIIPFVYAILLLVNKIKTKQI
jgi:uncharacterized membrane protein